MIFAIAAKSGWISQMCAGMELFLCSPVAPQLGIGVVSTNGAGFKGESTFTLRASLAALRQAQESRERATFSKSNRILR